MKFSKKKLSTLLLALLILAAYAFLSPEDAQQPPTPVSGELQVSFIDVGQGDSILVELGEEAMLIDCGTRSAGDDVLAYLAEEQVTALDHLVLTHPHEDHIGGAVDVLDNIPVGQVLMPEKTHTSATYGNTLDASARQGSAVTLAEPGSSFSLGDAVVEVLAPVQDYDDLNNCSVVLRLRYGETSFLFTGDAEAPAEADILNSGADVDADVLKLGHHGSDTSTAQDFLDAVSPEIAIASCGLDNEYGHPGSSTVEKLAASDIPLYRTDLQGTIQVTSDGENIRIYTEKDE